MPFCVLGPEMALGDPPSPAPRDLTGTTCNSPEMGSLQRWKRTMLPKLSGVKQRGLGSVFSGLSYNSFKSSMKRGASVKVTRRERKIVRAQDIFADEPILTQSEAPYRSRSDGNLLDFKHSVAVAPSHGRATTPMSAETRYRPNNSSHGNLLGSNRSGTIASSHGRAITPMSTEARYRSNSSQANLLGSNRSGTIATGHGRPITPMSALDLDKPLPEVPDEPGDIEADVSVQEFEGYLDMLGYLQRGLPSKPEDERVSPPPPPQVIIKPVVKEEEWLSSRSNSRQSTAYTPSEDELSRLRSRSGSGRRAESAAASRKTVTPMSSLSEGELCGVSNIPIHPAPVVASRIDEVSEPATSPSNLTPRRTSAAATPLTCYHCGRDPSGKDIKDMCGSPMTVIEISNSKGSSDQYDRDDKRASGPIITVKDDWGRSYVLDTRSSHYRALEEAEPDSTFVETEENADPFEFSSPFARPSNPEPYARDDSPSSELPEHDEPYLAQENVNIDVDWDHVPPPNHPTPPSPGTRSFPYKLSRSTPTDPDSPLSRHSRVRAHENREVGFELEPSFWKNPEGVIMVYHGIELNGNEVYFGNDINYLGSFYDDDEGSSGLGSTGNSTSNSTVDLVGTGSGLAVIPEGGSSDDLWDDEVFEVAD